MPGARCASRSSARRWLRIGSSQAYFDKGDFGVPAEVTQNGGPGILVDLGSVLDAPSAAIGGNVKEAVRVRHQSTAYVGPGARLRQNGQGPLSCDATSLVVTNAFRRSAACTNVEEPTEPRPARPNTLPQQ
jgi:hypothetical protein